LILSDCPGIFKRPHIACEYQKLFFSRSL
jgi:hypothetical protein